MADASGVTGVVKSWNGMKGYGFIASEGLPGDVMFSRNELPQDARGLSTSVLQGRAVTFAFAETPDGRLKATSVRVLAVEGCPLFGVVKSYNEKTGYGFIASSSLADDIRFTSGDLPPLVLGVGLVGLTVVFQVLCRPDGKLMAKDLQAQSTQQPAAAGNGVVVGHAGAVHRPGVAQSAAPVFGPALQTTQPQPMRQTTTSAGGFQMTGTVKSYSEKNGYGFICVPGHGGDVKFGTADLSGAGGIEVGSSVRFLAIGSPDGRLQARQVEPMGGPKRLATPATGPIMPTASNLQKRARVAPSAGGGDGNITCTGQVCVGVVKSYNAAKGFGFISSPEFTGDFYFMRKDITDPALEQSLAGGQSVSFEMAFTPDGKLRAVQVSSMSG